MKKELIFILILLLIPLVSADYFKFYEDFEIYPLGTIETSFWVPQYYPKTHIIKENSKIIEIDSFSEYKGDRDNHVLLNISNLSRIYNNLKISFDFKTLKCNSTWKMTQGVTPQASSIYVYYFDENNFISVEFKVNANETYCGEGKAQISAFRRVNGVSTSLIPFTTYNFFMNKTYRPTLEINNTKNETKILIQIENFSLFSSKFDYTKNGKILLETGGTSTLFDNVYISAKNIVCEPDWKENIGDCINKKQIHYYTDLNNCNSQLIPSNLTTSCSNNQARNNNYNSSSNFSFRYLSGYVSSNPTILKNDNHFYFKYMFGNTIINKISAPSFRIISIIVFIGMFIFCIYAWMNIRKIYP